MPYTLQLLRALIADHPDRAGRLQVHVEALEATIIGEPDRCLERVRALFEATFHSIAPHLGLSVSAGGDFPTQNSRIIKALDFALDGHPDSERIAEAIRRLVGSVNGTISALAELSNIPGMRHGGSLDWGTLQRHHALMLGGLCDTLVSFLFDVAWSRTAEAELPVAETYGDFADFDSYLDDEHETVVVAGATFEPSRILFTLDRTAYDAARQDWKAERVDMADEPGVAA